MIGKAAAVVAGLLVAACAADPSAATAADDLSKTTAALHETSCTTAAANATGTGRYFQNVGIQACYGSADWPAISSTARSNEWRRQS